MQFKYYVLNYDFNLKKIIKFNIFNNIQLNEATEKAVKKYIRAPSRYTYVRHFGSEVSETTQGFEGFCKELQHLIMWQEWGRSEYEMSVGSPFEKNVDNLTKIDCYEQCEPNISMIAREVIYQYKQDRRSKYSCQRKQ